METGLTIQQVAQQTGLSIDTLRYYERIGLLEPVGRAQNGHRRYTQRELDWIDLLIRLRNTGMPRAQMVRFAQLRRQGSATLTERRILLEQHQHSLEQRMQELEQHMTALQHKIARLKEREAQRDAGATEEMFRRAADAELADAQLLPGNAFKVPLARNVLDLIEEGDQS